MEIVRSRTRDQAGGGTGSTGDRQPVPRSARQPGGDAVEQEPEPEQSPPSCRARGP